MTSLDVAYFKVSRCRKVYQGGIFSRKIILKQAISSMICHSLPIYCIVVYQGGYFCPGKKSCKGPCHPLFCPDHPMLRVTLGLPENDSRSI